MNRPLIPIVRHTNAVGLPLPSYATPLSSGMDLYAAIPSIMRISPHEREVVPTGISIALPPDCEAQIRSRSGLAAREGIMVLNSPGTIDADYRGEISVILYNTSDNIFILKRGMKIAQMVIAPVIRIDWHEIKNLDATQRGAGGFGSTGV